MNGVMKGSAGDAVSGIWLANTVLPFLSSYPSSLPSSILVNIVSPGFAGGEGTGAYAEADMTNVIVYSRNPPPPPPPPPPVCDSCVSPVRSIGTTICDGANNLLECQKTGVNTCPWVKIGTCCTPSCTPACGQADGCGGTCASTAVGTPAASTIVSPAGTAVAPTVILDSTSTTLTWLQNSSTLTDSYQVEVYRVSDGVRVSNSVVVGRANVSLATGALSYEELYYWRVRAINDTCSPVLYGAWSSNGYFIFNHGLSLTSFVLKNGTSETVVAEAGGRNHLCQSEFLDSRRVVFSVTVTDGDGGDSIDEVRLRLRQGGADSLVVGVTNLTGTPVSSLSGSNASFWGSEVTTSVLGNTRTVNFYVEFGSGFNQALYDMAVYAVDNWGSILNWADTARDFKVWDCLVSVSGEMYDATAELSGPVCPSTGYSTLVGAEVHFVSLSYTDKEMTVTVPASYDSGGNKLVWGSSYVPIFADLAGSIPTMRVTNAPVGSQCPASLTVNSTIVSAYDSPPTLDVDFATILEQDPWFQAVGAGIKAGVQVLNNVPRTCQLDPVCQAAMSVEEIGVNMNGLVAAPVISNESGCEREDCPYGLPNDWGVTANTLGEKCDYTKIYNSYYVKLEQGEVYTTDTSMSTIVADLGGTGVAFVAGDLTVDIDNTVAVGDFLMVNVSGTIVIESGVDQTEGVLVADGGIVAGGESATQLNINGMMCSKSGTIRLNRSYSDKSDNNTSPPMVINYRPDFIFSMPAKMVKVLSGWREGR